MKKPGTHFCAPGSSDLLVQRLPKLRRYYSLGRRPQVLIGDADTCVAGTVLFNKAIEAARI